MKEKQTCPYCNRRVKYLTRLIEHGNGEHKCTHCKKIANITQDKRMWALFLITLAAALLIMIYYFVFSGPVMDAYINDGSFKILNFLFFGKGKEIKWLIWEMIPFIVFYFVSPVFMGFSPQKRFIEYTTTSIDLDVPNMPKVDKKIKTDGNTRAIPRAGSEYTGVFEDISSNSGEGIDKTRAFDVNKLN